MDLETCLHRRHHTELGRHGARQRVRVQAEVVIHDLHTSELGRYGPRQPVVRQVQLSLDRQAAEFRWDVATQSAPVHIEPCFDFSHGA